MDNKEQIITEKQIRIKTLVSFFFFFLFIFAMILGWQWLQRQPKEQGAIKPLRTVLDGNEAVFSNFFSDRHIARTYSKNLVTPNVKVNGSVGMNKDFDPSTWKLKLAKAPGDTIYITLDEIKALPKTEIIFDFKCIEGWSQVTHWGGVRFSDFVKKYKLDELKV